MKIGNKISELRKKTNTTQEQLALKLNVTRQTISNWESDITSPDLKQASLLSTIFNISISDLIDDDLHLTCKNIPDTILTNLIGKECFLETQEEDYRVDFNTPCKIISINDCFVKFEFTYNKQKITKLVDIDLISSFRIVTKKEVK